MRRQLKTESQNANVLAARFCPISEYYPKEIRATGIGWALGVGRLGAIIAPSLFALILASGMEPKQAFMVFAIPSVFAALGIMLVQEKHASFDFVSKSESAEFTLPGRPRSDNSHLCPQNGFLPLSMF